MAHPSARTAPIDPFILLEGYIVAYREEEDGTTPACSLSHTTTYVDLTFHDSVC